MPNYHAIVFLLVLAASSTLVGTGRIVPGAKAHAAQISLSAFTSTSPTIDGIIGDSEWANAARMNFVGVYGVIQGSFLVMNDVHNLYLGVRIADTQLPGRALNISIDNNHDGTWDVGEKDFTFYIGMLSFDRYLYISTPGLLAAQPDVNDGGTTDGSAAATNSGGFNTYEFSTPLCSSDTKHDFCLSPGDTIGFNLIYGIFGDGGDDWPAQFLYPLNDASHWGDIKIASPIKDVTVSVSFTDGGFSPLLMDNFGNPKVDVVFANGVVRSTNPGEIIAWVNVTDTAGSPVQSLKVNETLPSDWIVAPTWLPGKGGVHVYYANTTSLSTNPEITDPTTITVTSGNPQVVSAAIPNFNATAIGHPLLVGQSILLAVKVMYRLDKTTQVFSTYPRNYTNTANLAAWSQPLYTSTQTSTSGSSSFTAFARLLGDLNGDNKVDIQDVAIVAYAYGTRAGDSRWNASADLDNDGRVDIGDAAIVAFYYGTSA